jgi:hypothetical protein
MAGQYSIRRPALAVIPERFCTYIFIIHRPQVLVRLRVEEATLKPRLDLKLGNSRGQKPILVVDSGPIFFKLIIAELFGGSQCISYLDSLLKRDMLQLSLFYVILYNDLSPTQAGEQPFSNCSSKILERSRGYLTKRYIEKSHLLLTPIDILEGMLLWSAHTPCTLKPFF